MMMHSAMRVQSDYSSVRGSFFSSVNDAISDIIAWQNARGSVLIKIVSYRSPLMFATAEREGDRTLYL